MADVRPAQALELMGAELAGVSSDAALSTACRNAPRRMLDRHYQGQCLAFVEVEIRRDASAVPSWAQSIGMANTVGIENAAAAIIHFQWNAKTDDSGRSGQKLDDIWINLAYFRCLVHQARAFFKEVVHDHSPKVA